ncbi:hypothetical protein LAUMK13_03861 [Mycobacterium innocens]|uniref:Uncharacterized protein n=1 Tax=Mycobacterium innocens TaxID=2341083 RepID=A0A498Q9U7_9MYCO|nr:hypothetical protein LAUMK13_03861 [Mycobacterium innocens]
MTDGKADIASRTSISAKTIDEYRDLASPHRAMHQRINPSLRMPRRFLDELEPGGDAELGVDVGEVGLHGPR